MYSRSVVELFLLVILIKQGQSIEKSIRKCGVIIINEFKIFLNKQKTINFEV
jgi:hypothetical protein